MTIHIDKELRDQMIEARDRMTDMAKTLEALGTDLDAAVSSARDEFADRTDRWQEGERGQVVSEWIDNVEAFAEQVNEISDLLTDAVDSIENLEDKP